ncbi:hypothetical protein R3P38DRAFT_3584979 [Favolaschia claudopus]|uniref:F-box domain-containing protein n=1 Tax=Favolaschia claudopus TaxID=2862362 RepID=A0AAW0AIW2_9AGAR
MVTAEGGTSTAHRAESQEGLPTELLLVIFQHLRRDRNALRQACLASRQFLSLSQPCLFEHISLRTQRLRLTKSQSLCSSLYQILCESPHIVTYIRHMDIVSATYVSGRVCRWISGESTLHPLLTFLVDAKILQTFRLRLSGASWEDLPLKLKHSIRLLMNSPALRNLDLTGFIYPAPEILACVHSLDKLKISGTTSFCPEKLDPEGPLNGGTITSFTLLDTVPVADVID